MFQRINLEEWDRRAVFEEFIDLDCSYSLTQDLCITEFYNYIKTENLRFYPSFTWAVINTINKHKEFRMGYDEHGNVGYYDFVNPEYTVLNRKTKNMESLNTEYCDDFPVFYRAMAADMDRFEREGVGTVSRENSVLVSCAPWYSYTSLTFQMKSSIYFLRPMIVWGKYQIQEGKVILPFTIQMHHGAADAYHCHLLFEDLMKIINNPKNELKWTDTSGAGFHK